MRVSGAKVIENPSIEFTLDERITPRRMLQLPFYGENLTLTHCVDSKFLPTNLAVCFIAKICLIC